jgi:hypothetical protein
MKTLLNFSYLILVFAFSSCGNDYFKDSCGCKADWKEKLAKSPMTAWAKERDYKIDDTYMANDKKMWPNAAADKFISLIGGKKTKEEIGEPDFILELAGDILRISEYGGVLSYNYGIDFRWKFEENKLIFYRDSDSKEIFKIGEIVIESNKPVFYESEENKAERGILENKLPSQVLDFCACKCELMDKGYSNAKAIESCHKYLNPENPLIKPWGEIKEVLK